ncbi:cytochrome P450 [Trametes gibbosa]|nr:cytochrome P450 [Trametes gibbosa]
MAQPYVFTIDDASSVINYHPQGDGGLGDQTQNGWQPFYDTAGGFSTRGGEAALGNSKFITAFPNASLDFQFYGDSVSIFGIANCSYDVSVDGNSSLFKASKSRGQSTMLFSKEGLSEGTHTVSLTAHASNTSSFAFQRADVTRSVPAGGRFPSAHVYQATNTSFIQYSGNWSVLSDPLIPNQQHPAPYLEIEDAPASFSFSFQGVGVAINGSRNWGSFVYDVSLDGQPTTYNASTMWFIGDALLYYQDGLDPNATHKITVSPNVGSGLKFWLNTVTVFTDDPSEAGGLVSSPSSNNQPAQPTSDTQTSNGQSKTNVGVIVGPVIGGAVLLALIATLIWYFRHKRQNRVLDDGEQPSPFMSAPASQPVTFTPGRDTKVPMLSSDGDYYQPHIPTLPMMPSAPSAHSDSAHTVSDSPLLQAPVSASTSRSQLASSPQSSSSPTTTHAGSPAMSSPPSDPTVAVDRIIQLITERMADVPPQNMALEPHDEDVHSGGYMVFLMILGMMKDASGWSHDLPTGALSVVFIWRTARFSPDSARQRISCCRGMDILAFHIAPVHVDHHQPAWTPSPGWFFGQMKVINEEENSAPQERWAAQYGSTMMYRGFLSLDRLWTIDPRALNHILTIQRTTRNQTRRGKVSQKFWGRRRIMNPAFGPAQIRELTSIFVDKAKELRDFWDARMNTDVSPVRIDVLSGLSKMTLDVIGLAGFNYRFDALNPNGKTNELNQAFQDIFNPSGNFTMWMLVKHFFPIFEIFGDERARRLEHAQAVMRRIGTQLIREKKAEISREADDNKNGGLERKDVVGRDLLTLLLKANMATDIPDNVRLSDEDVLAQVPTFLVAGHETTSTATTWCLYALSQALGVQKKLRDELLALQTDTPTMDELNGLPYLDAVSDVIPVSEPFVDRFGKVQNVIRISKGTPIVIPILSLNRSKKLWGEDAFDFKPERWENLPEAVSSIPGVWGHMLSFLGARARASDTAFLSSSAMKALIFTLVRAFEFELAVDASDVQKKTSIVQRPLLRSAPEQGSQMPLLVKRFKVDNYERICNSNSSHHEPPLAATGSIPYTKPLAIQGCICIFSNSTDLQHASVVVRG